MRNLLVLAITILGFSFLASQGLHDAVYRSIAIKRPAAHVIPQMVHLLRAKRILT